MNPHDSMCYHAVSRWHRERMDRAFERGDGAEAMERARRCTAWVATGSDVGLSLRLRGIQYDARPALPDPLPRLEQEAGNVAVGSMATMDGARVIRWRLTGELLDRPVGWPGTGAGDLLDLEITNGLGGCGQVAMQMLDLVAGIPAGRVRCTVRGLGAASAHAFLAALWPGRRRIEEGSRLLTHGTTGAAFGEAPALRAEAERVEAFNRRLAVLLARRTGRPVRDCWRWVRPGVDVTFTAQAAVEAGLVDEVIGDGAE